jgi:hypothetical protein
MKGKLAKNLLSMHNSVIKNKLQESTVMEIAHVSCWQRVKSITLGKKTWGTEFYFWLVFFLEFTSCLDLIGDCLVFGELFQRHPAWATLSVYFMLSPFYVSYIPLINF